MREPIMPVAPNSAIFSVLLMSMFLPLKCNYVDYIFV
jgi:hypothetical protein